MLVSRRSTSAAVDDESLHLLEHLDHVAVVGSHDRHRDRRPLPRVVMVDLGHRQVEPVAHAFHDRLHGRAWPSANGLRARATRNITARVHAAILAPVPAVHRVLARCAPERLVIRLGVSDEPATSRRARRQGGATTSGSTRLLDTVLPVPLHPAARRSSPACNNRDLALLAVLYLGRMFFITAGYHRYFSHRSYKLGRVHQFVMAFGGADLGARRARCGGRRTTGTTTATRTPRTTSTPPVRGFWWSHMGWILCDSYDATPTATRSRTSPSIPELRWLEPRTTGAAVDARPSRASCIGGWSGLRHRVLLVDGRCCGTATFTHQLAGPRVRAAAATPPTDTSRNSLLARAAHAGRGLAQQPPPLPGVGTPGLLLVGDRRRALRPACCRVDEPHDQQRPAAPRSGRRRPGRVRCEAMGRR